MTRRALHVSRFGHPGSGLPASVVMGIKQVTIGLTLARTWPQPYRATAPENRFARVAAATFAPV